MRDVAGGTNEGDHEVVKRHGGQAGEFEFEIGGARGDVGQRANTAAQRRARAGAPLPEQVVAAKREGGKLIGTAGRESRRGAKGAERPDGAVEPGDVASGILGLPPLVDDAPGTKLARLGAVGRLHWKAGDAALVRKVAVRVDDLVDEVVGLIAEAQGRACFDPAVAPTKAAAK